MLFGTKFKLTRERVRQIRSRAKIAPKFNLRDQTLIKEVLECIEKGESISTLYKKYNQSTISYIFRKILKRSAKSIQTEKRRDRIIQLYKDGFSMYEISERVVMTYTYVVRILSIAGVRPSRRLTKDRNLVILKTYYTTNKTKREVEREFGVSRNIPCSLPAM